jgi:mono/diheme cytochrome c family protein
VFTAPSTSSVTHPRRAALTRVRLGRLVAVSVPALIVAGLVASAAQPAGPDGARLYRSYCASCHGASGRGDGPMVQFLRVPPTDLTQLTSRHGGTFNEDEVARAIDGRIRIGSHGPSDMPVWGDAFSSSLARGSSELAYRDRVRAIVRYLASLQERPAP